MNSRLRSLPRPRLRPWSAVLGAGTLAAVGFLLLPDTGPWRPASVLVAGLVSTLVIVVGTVRYRPARRRTWVALGVAHVSGVVAWAGFYAVPVLTRGAVLPSPIWSVLFLLAPGAGAGGLLLAVGATRRRDRLAVIDTALFSVAVGVLSWALVISRFTTADGLNPAERLLSVGYLLLNMLLLAATARLAFTTPRHPRTRLLVLSAVATVSANTVYSVHALQGTFEVGGPVFAAWLMSYAALGAAALHPAVPSPGEIRVDEPVEQRPAPRAVGSSRLRQAVLVAAVAPLPLLLVVRAVQQSPSDVIIIAAGSLVVTALALARGFRAIPSTVTPKLRRDLRRAAAQMVAAFVVLAFFPLTSLAYLGVTQSKHTMEAEVRARMATVSEVSSNYVAEKVEGIQKLVVSYAGRPALVGALSGRAPDLAEVQRHLASLQEAHGDLFSAWLMDPRGILHAIAPTAPEVIGQSYAQRDYYRGALAADGAYVSSAFVAARFGHPRAIGISAPIRDAHGRVLAVLAVGYRLDGIRTFGDRLAAAQKVELTVTDQSSVILAGGDAAPSGLPSAAADPRVAAALRGETATREMAGHGGAPSFSSYRQVPPLGWAVVAETPQSVALAAQRRLAARIVAVAVLLGQALLVGLVAAIRTDRGRRLVAAQLSEREEHLRDVLEAAGDAYLAVDADNRITEWNAQAVAVFGYPRDVAIGANISELVVPEANRDGHSQDMAHLLRGDDLRLLGERIEVITRRADGTQFPAEVTRWGAAKGGSLTFNAFVRDVTDRKRREAELAAARDQALEASRLKSEFVANMSHEIRTPMNGVLGMSSLLLDTDLDPVQRDYAHTIGSSAESLLTVINDILDFSKIEAGKLDLEEADFLLRPVVEDTVGLLASAAQAKGLEITALVDAAVPAAVRGDSHRLRQVLTNLVGNAVKFTEHGEVAVHVTTVANGIRFTVRDTGIGIAPAERERLFQSFTQADTSTTRRYGGTGLGLTISRQLVQLMDGTLDFISEPGRGTTFRVDLPLPRAASPLAVTPLRDYPTDARVLVVDDNATNRKVLRQFLTSWSLEPHDATDGPSALAALRGAVAAGTPFDAVILDMRMPGMSGIEVAHAVFGDDALTGTPIAVLTSTGIDSEVAAARAAGVELCLTKPVREAQLYDCVSRLLGTTAGRRGGTGNAAPRRQGTGRLLVAEDNRVNQRVVVAMLEALGFDVDVAADGVQALERFATGQYAAVLMDCQMPQLDGYAATRALRRMGGRGAEVPIIALTASALASDEARCREAGMDDFVTKPLRPETLARVLDRWVGGVAPSGALVDPLDHTVLADLGTVDAELVNGVVTAFLDTVPTVTAELRAAVEAGDVAEVRRLAHGIRGSAGYVGAPALVAACAELENAEPARAGELFATVEAELERVRASLRLVLAGESPTP